MSRSLWPIPPQYFWFHSSVLGYQPPLFPCNTMATNSNWVGDWFRQSKQVWESTYQYLERLAQWNKIFADQHWGQTPHYNPDDWVWQSMRDTRKTGMQKTVQGTSAHSSSCNNEVTYKLNLPCNWQLPHVSCIMPKASHLRATIPPCPRTTSSTPFHWASTHIYH